VEIEDLGLGPMRLGAKTRDRARPVIRTYLKIEKCGRLE
jgi:hypothetical protein